MHGHTLRACREAVGLLAEAVGTAAIHRGCGLEPLGPRPHHDRRARRDPAAHQRGRGRLWLGAEDLLSENPLLAEGLL